MPGPPFVGLLRLAEGCFGGRSGAWHLPVLCTATEGAATCRRVAAPGQVIFESSGQNKTKMIELSQFMRSGQCYHGNVKRISGPRM